MTRRLVVGLAARVLAVGVAATVAFAPAQPALAADPISKLQWFLDAVKAPQAQRVTKGDGVVVAVIDSGVDAKHPDLAGAVLSGAAFSGSSSKDGRTDPVGHGTRMAGIIAARGGGGNHALGVAPRSKILPVAVDAESTGSLAQPIRWAVDHGAKVINLSVGRSQAEAPPADELAAIAYAQAKDVVVVSSAGNVDQTGAGVGSPANIPGVIAVSGTQRSGQFWAGSAQGPTVALAAPAQDIVTAGGRNAGASGYTTGGATSEASAIVSGVAALVRAKFPKLNAINVINRLLKTATDEGDPGRDELYGFGLVDAEQAVTANVPAVHANPLGAQAAGSPTAGAGSSVDNTGTGDGGALGSSTARAALVLGVAAFGLLLFVILILLVARSARRRAARPAAMPPSFRAPSGYPPTGGYPPPPGHPPAGSYPPPPGGYPPGQQGYPSPGGLPPAYPPQGQPSQAGQPPGYPLPGGQSPAYPPPGQPSQSGQPPAYPPPGGLPPAYPPQGQPSQSGQPPGYPLPGGQPSQSGQPPAYRLPGGQPPAYPPGGQPSQAGQPPGYPFSGGQPPGYPAPPGYPPPGYPPPGHPAPSGYPAPGGQPAPSGYPAPGGQPAPSGYPDPGGQPAPPPASYGPPPSPPPEDGR